MKFDVIVIGGGHSGMEMAMHLQQSGLQCAVVSKGGSLYDAPQDGFRANGGTILTDEAVSGTIQDGVVTGLATACLGDDTLTADKYYLATGKFFTGGLRADMDRVYEPIFGIDVRYEHDRDRWFGEKFDDPQPFMSFGVETSGNGCALKDGKEVSNLFPIGEIKAE